MSDERDIVEEFHKLNYRRDISKILEIKDKSLRYFLYGIKPDNMYTENLIKKRNGGTRTISVPDKRLKGIQKKLLRILEKVYKVKPSAYGFVANKNNILNAKNHCKRKNVFNVDLKDFFEQIHFGSIVGMFKSEPYKLGHEAALVMAQIVCYKGKLPQGAPTSPIISNMICSPLDTQLTRLAKKYKIVYTRYADDITFSTFKDEFPKEIVDIVSGKACVGKELNEILARNSFEVNRNKIYLRSKNERQEVTGLVVNKFVNLKNEYIKDIRAILHNCEKIGIYETAERYVLKGYCNSKAIKDIVFSDKKETLKPVVVEWFEKVLKGKIEYIKSVRGIDNPYYLKYALQMNKIFAKEIFSVEKQKQFWDNCEKFCLILESRDENHPNQGSAFVLKDYGIFTNYHVTKDDAFYDVKTYKGKKVGLISRSLNKLYENTKIDYCLYKYSMKKHGGWELGDSQKIQTGTKVKLVGFPNYSEGDTPYIEDCKVTSKKCSYRGEDIYTVSGRIVHGASGGVVLDDDYKVIGIIECGSNKLIRLQSLLA